MFDHQGRKPWASVNFITAHDGFTLADLWSYNSKHNEANQEGNRDGHDDNRSWNCGVEGPTDDPAVLDLRDRMRRNIAATMLLSQGTPMILMGDEVGRTPAAATTTPIARTTRSPGSTGRTSASATAPSWSSCAASSASASAIRILRANRFLHGEPIDENGTRERRLVPTRRQEMTPGNWSDTNARVDGPACFRTTAPAVSSWPAPTTGRCRSRCRVGRVRPGRCGSTRGRGDRSARPALRTRLDDRARRPFAARSRRGDGLK